MKYCTANIADLTVYRGLHRGFNKNMVLHATTRTNKNYFFINVCVQRAHTHNIEINFLKDTWAQNTQNLISLIASLTIYRHKTLPASLTHLQQSSNFYNILMFFIKKNLLTIDMANTS